MLELNKIYNMDCLELLKQLPDNYIDLALLDPPYGLSIASIGKVGGGNACEVTQYKASEWDSCIPSKEYFDEIKRVSKNQIIFGGNYFLDYLGATKCLIIWDKGRRETNFADCEIAWTSFNKPSRIIKYVWDGMRQEDMKYKENRVHPTQKPLKLALKLINDYSNEGDIILDTHFGSGTFILASKLKGRRFIGSEIDIDYFNICKDRLNQENLLTILETSNKG